MRPNMLTTLVVSLALASHSAGQGTQAGAAKPGRTSSSLPPGLFGPEEKPVNAGPTLRAGQVAEKRGDFASAERLYLSYLLQKGDPSFEHIHLARLYDHMGRDREAYAQYRITMDRRVQGWTSTWEDPRALARYGDLALRFGDRDLAVRSYAEAAGFSGQDDHWNPVTSPRTKDLRPLQAAALTAAAINLRGVGRDEESIVALRRAASADPQYWVPHFYLAQSLRADHDEAVREAEKAGRMAPSAKYREMVRRMRKDLSL